MADISSEINKITEAILGEEVRGSIKDALILMNKELEKGTTKVTPTEVDNASECIAEGTFYKVLIGGSPSIITTSLDAGGATGVQYRFASTGSGSTGAIYYRTFTVNPFSAGEWINVSTDIDQTTLETIVNRYLQSIGIDTLVEYIENKKTYNHYNTSVKTLSPNVDIYIDKYPFTSMNRSPEVSVEEGDDSKYPSLKGMKQFLGACLFSMPEMFKNANDPDDTYSIQKAINYSIRTGIPFKCEKSKTYNISKPLYIRVLSDISLVFDFCNASLKCIDDQNVMPYILRFNRLTPAHYDDLHQSRVKITNVALDAVNEYAHTGLYIDRTVSDVFENISVFNARRGIYVSGGVEAILQNCYVLRSINEGNVDQIMIDYDLYKNPYGESYQTYTDDDLWWNNNSNITACEYFSKVLGDTSRYDEEDKYYRISLEDGTTITDPSRTENVGIEVLITDSWVQNCVVINHTVGIAIKNGDTKILGCHPWVDNENVVKNATAYYNEGTNYYSDCTCDRFKIGFYCGNNAPMYLTNTHISSKPTSETIAAFEAYCFYIPSTVYHRGSEIHAVNTKIHGIKDSWADDDNPNTKNIVVIPKNWTNIPGGCISDINTSGYGVLNYLNSNLNNGETFKIINPSNGYSIPLYADTGIVNDLKGQKNVGDHSPSTPAYGMISTGISWTTFKEDNIVYHRLDGDASGRTQRLTLIHNKTCTTDGSLFLTLSYKTNIPVGYTIALQVLVNDTQIGLEYIFRSGNINHIGLVIDDLKIDDTITISISFGTQDFNYGDDSEGNYYFYFWNIMAFDFNSISDNISRYYLESKGEYANRISKFISNKLSDTENGIIETPVIVPGLTDQNNRIRYKSEKIKIDIDYPGENRLNNRLMSAFYKVRYDLYGNPIVNAKNTDGSGQIKTCEEYALLSKTAPNLLVGVFESAIYKCLHFSQVGDEASVSSMSNDTEITCPYYKGTVKMALNLSYTRTGRIASLRFGTDYLEPDTRLTAPGEIIKCYPDGKIYAVMLDSEGENDLPTFAYTLEDI